ncbi:hypothetical protein LOTGIDRAFT_109060 [Lottia gigantea]|uniref:E3 ubiquitin-protein ligase n=1 Tax=Lottia gigantea TaxID=225164 RepID=V3ZKF6_LOTGI|nr:hypothetical protein LOTGIDRAFT_109060 [Lottia gigantea]ESO82855.1 hypothetical protein LOTGIDRAFT_109060 [Lottia gigantea]
MTSLPVDLNKELARRANDPQTETCGICLDEILDPKVLDKCGHKFCQGCVKHAFVCKPVCPECGMIYGVIIGDQPRGGKMIHKLITSHKLEGYKDADGILEIIYTFNDGIQQDNHPNPGQPYSGLRRKAYLPNNKEGQEILQMLYKAFDARLIFTIGESRTTGQTGVLTWNDIHHKTSITGGALSHGYPDLGYLKRVREELALKGIKK